jgi:hypothetical protein
VGCWSHAEQGRRLTGSRVWVSKWEEPTHPSQFQVKHRLQLNRQTQIKQIS